MNFFFSSTVKVDLDRDVHDFSGLSSIDVESFRRQSSISRELFCSPTANKRTTTTNPFRLDPKHDWPVQLWKSSAFPLRQRIVVEIRFRCIAERVDARVAETERRNWLDDAQSEARAKGYLMERKTRSVESKRRFSSSPCSCNEAFIKSFWKGRTWKCSRAIVWLCRTFVSSTIDWLPALLNDRETNLMRISPFPVLPEKNENCSSKVDWRIDGRIAEVEIVNNDV